MLCCALSGPCKQSAVLRRRGWGSGKPSGWAMPAAPGSAAPGRRGTGNRLMMGRDLQRSQDVNCSGARGGCGHGGCGRGPGRGAGWRHRAAPGAARSGRARPPLVAGPCAGARAWLGVCFLRSLYRRATTPPAVDQSKQKLARALSGQTGPLPRLPDLAAGLWAGGAARYGPGEPGRSAHGGQQHREQAPRLQESEVRQNMRPIQRFSHFHGAMAVCTLPLSRTHGTIRAAYSSGSCTCGWAGESRGQ